jgi:nicotinate-nucleotide--dimethylbenzimidazole phosphoribosyltransferase
VLFGEMGIANTSSAALLMARLGGLPIEQCVGRGTGLDEAGLAHKTGVLREALALHEGITHPVEALAALGGFEIAMMAGAMLQAAHERRLLVIDGFIVCAALLVASRLAPAVLDYCVFAHRGAEAGHARLLQLLQAQALLDLELRLGEGSGAALAWPLVDAAARVLREMASFESAGVSDRA